MTSSQNPAPFTGMSAARLERVGAHIQKYVDAGKLPGASILITRGFEHAYYFETGYADVERKQPIQRDTVFRYYSMTKPITSAALMTLYEHGLFQLDDPVSKYIPAWKNLRVYEGGEGKSMKTRELDNPMTIKHLLTHTSGLTYGFMQSHPVDALYREKQVGGGPGRTLDDMIEGLAEIPLVFEPGSRWHYSVATDVCGYLVQHFSGQDLDEYIAETIQKPLAMLDSGFSVPSANQDRLAACYSHHPSGFRLQDDPETSNYLKRPTYLSGGGGMVGTIDDYMAFGCMMLGYTLNVDDDPILGLRTRQYMLANHLPGNVDLAAMGQAVFSETSFEGVGFGLGFSTVVNPMTSSVLDNFGAAGWGGAASTYFWVDPRERIVVVFMTQLLPSSTFPIRRELKALVNQAILTDAVDLDLEDLGLDDMFDPEYDEDYPDLDENEIRN